MSEADKLRIISFFHKSMAFLQIAHMASSQKDEETFLTEDYQNVVVYLIYHSFELFLKFCILTQSLDMDEVQITLKSFNHDINHLYIEYTTIYSEKKYIINHPFEFSIDIESASDEEMVLWENHMSKFSPKYFDQYMKYPMSKNGNYTGGAYIIRLEAEWIEKFKNELSTIGSEIINNLLNDESI